MGRVSKNHREPGQIGHYTGSLEFVGLDSFRGRFRREQGRQEKPGDEGGNRADNKENPQTRGVTGNSTSRPSISL
jgi:hypothetical protein